MFKNFAILACVLGIATFGSEVIYRFRSDNRITDSGYIIQSNMVISASAISMILSIHIIKMTEFISVKAMRLLALISIGLLCVSIALRTKYMFLMLPQDSINNMYNATSFLICITTICWTPFFVYKKPIDQNELPSFPTTEELRRRRYDQLIQRRNTEQGRVIVPTGVATDSHFGAGREEEILPSYYELPAPPVYSKTEATEASTVENNQHDTSAQHTTESTVTQGNDVIITMDSNQLLSTPADTHNITATTNEANRQITASNV